MAAPAQTASAGVIGAGNAPAATSSVASGQVAFGGNDALSGIWAPNGHLAYSSHSFSTSNGDYVTVAGSNTGLTVSFGTSAQKVLGSLLLEPPPGQQLAVGTYAGAIWPQVPPVMVSAPGLDLTFNSTSCMNDTGSFTIYQIAVGADGSIDSLDATFDEVCDYFQGESQGRVLINVAGPPLQTLTESLAATGLVTTGRPGGQRATLRGTVTCTQAGQITITATLFETNSQAYPQLSGTVTCTPGSAVPWTASGVSPYPPSPGPGTAKVTASGVFDPYYLITPTAYLSTSVQLVPPVPQSCAIFRCARVSHL